MPQSTHSDERFTVTPAPSAIGPRTVAMLWSCAGVCTGYVLGISAITAPVLGLPLGAWVVAGSVAATHLYTSRRRQRFDNNSRNTTSSTPLCHSATLPLSHFLPPSLLSNISLPRWGSLERITSSAVTYPLRNAADAVRNLETLNPLSRLREASADGVKTLRIGVDLSDTDALHLMQAGSRSLSGDLRIVWTRTTSGAFNAAREDLRGHDALIRRRLDRPGDQPSAFAFIPEDCDHPAGWFDWNIVPPLSFASLFPTRTDPAQIELAGCNFSDPDQARLAAAMIVAAAAMGRADCRLRDSRWSARTPIGSLTDPRGHITAAMTDVVSAFETLATKLNTHGETETPAYFRAAARLIAAWASTNDFALNADHRDKLLALTAEGLETEPQQILRVAAAQFAVGNSDAGIRSLLWARRRLRATATECVVDPLPFVQSEIELGRPGTLSLGRVAAGLTLLWSTSTADKHAYLRDDLTDDLRHAGWLAGRDDDRATLMRVMDELDRAEQTDSTMPVRRAA